MKVSHKMAMTFFFAHSVMPVLIFFRLIRISDVTERWANTLIFYIVDFPLLPIFLWFQDKPKISESSFINTGISFMFGGLFYAAIGLILGQWLIYRRRKKDPTTGSNAR